MLMGNCCSSERKVNTQNIVTIDEDTIYDSPLKEDNPDNITMCILKK
tara:strand:- start:1262 stop:1402 length:141 start_codon:yes stop_codon:yes gene_type:complete